jgi:hypothetical protein
VSAASDRTGVTHSVQKLLLIRARMLTRQLNFDVQGPSVRDTMTPNIGLAVMTNVDDRAVLGVELPYRVVDCIAAVPTESHDYFVL